MKTLVESHKACAADSDCQYLFGYCGVGTGGSDAQSLLAYSHLLSGNRL